MKIHFHGAAQTVTGSQHLLEINGKRLLLDCGLYQGSRNETYEVNKNFRFAPSKVDAMLLSHAHIDHVGNLPNLVKNGFDGPVHCTFATAHLSDVMMRDSAKIQEQDIEFVNKKRARRGEDPIEPLYAMEDAVEASTYLHGIAYDSPFEPIPGVQARFIEAGHILGSAAIVLDIEERGRKFRLWFSGDIGRYNKPILRDPVLPSDADYLLMECTYGDKLHDDPEASLDELRNVITRTVNRGGKVIIPAFAVGRTQELVYYLHQMINAGDIPHIPVYVDSPLAVNISEVFRQHTECFDEETWEFMQSDKNRSVFGFDRLTYVRSVEESKALNDRKDPMIIISASGMAETGRILHHLKNNVENPKNTVLICSWQAPNTLGRRIADREERIKIFGEPYIRRCEVATIGGFSAHAGQNLLRDYALAVKDQVKKVFLVHGEARGAEPLMEILNGEGMNQVYFPAIHTTWEIT
ncbi:MAG TPA: MBL fold metallo-hydrolase [Anaerolineales bacterium]|nr:MBL fold metallo-hydrolase [Anaerolineales bacterium]